MGDSESEPCLPFSPVNLICCFQWKLETIVFITPSSVLKSYYGN